MELPNLGKQCGVNSCQQLDFLPFKCNFCSITFCKEHNLAFYHDCSQLPDKANHIKQSSEEYSYHCSLNDCSQFELIPVTCHFCQNMFCLKHRHQIDHDCCKYVSPQNPMAEAAAKVQQMTDNLICTKPKRVLKKNEKLAAKIQLMKLKGKAIGGNHLPGEERVYFLVEKPSSYHPSDSIAVCVSHHWSVGRVIDALAELLKVQNRNNESTVDVLRIFKKSDGALLSPIDTLIKVLLDQEIIYNGQSLLLELVSKEITHLPVD